MSTDKLSELKDVVDYWRKVKSGELPAPGLNEISITVCAFDEAVSRITALLAGLEAKDKRIAELEADKRQLNEIINSEANRANAAEKRITEMEFNELNLIAERDNAENVVTNMYRAATGDSPEWSNWFGFADAIEEVAQIRAKLATPVRLPTKSQPTGNYEHDKIAFHRASAIDNCALAIRAAGFTVEGDD